MRQFVIRALLRDIVSIVIEVPDTELVPTLARLEVVREGDCEVSSELVDSSDEHIIDGTVPYLRCHVIWNGRGRDLDDSCCGVGYPYACKGIGTYFNGTITESKINNLDGTVIEHALDIHDDVSYIHDILGGSDLHRVVFRFIDGYRGHDEDREEYVVTGNGHTRLISCPFMERVGVVCTAGHGGIGLRSLDHSTELQCLGLIGPSIMIHEDHGIHVVVDPLSV